jgi:hypothetical protein
MAAAMAAGFGLLAVGTARAHCDTTGGPIIPEARAALEKGDVTPMLKWIKADDETEIKAAFAKAVAVRAKGPEAKELADQYFLETLVRLHRAGEGAAYTGIKDEAVSPFVALVDRTLEDGSPDALIARMSGHLARAAQERFDKALAARKNKDKSVEAGREYVEAYVAYMHYLENVRNAIMAVGGHQHAAAATPPAGHEQHSKYEDALIEGRPMTRCSETTGRETRKGETI